MVLVHFFLHVGFLLPWAASCWGLDSSDPDWFAGVQDDPGYEVRVSVIDGATGLLLSGVQVNLSFGQRDGRWRARGNTDETGAVVLRAGMEGIHFISLSGGSVVPEQVQLPLSKNARSIVVPCTLGTQLSISSRAVLNQVRLYRLGNEGWKVFTHGGKSWRAEKVLRSQFIFDPVPAGIYAALILSEDLGGQVPMDSAFQFRDLRVMAQVDPFEVMPGPGKRMELAPSTEFLDRESIFQLTGFGTENADAALAWPGILPHENGTWSVSAGKLRVRGLPFCGLFANVVVQGHGQRVFRLLPMPAGDQEEPLELWVPKCEKTRIQVIDPMGRLVTSMVFITLEDGLPQVHMLQASEENMAYDGRCKLSLPVDATGFLVNPVALTDPFKWVQVALSDCIVGPGFVQIRLPMIDAEIGDGVVGFRVVSAKDKSGWFMRVREFSVTFLDASGSPLFSVDQRDLIGSFRNRSHSEDSSRPPETLRQFEGSELDLATRDMEVLWTAFPADASSVRIELKNGKGVTLPMEGLQIGAVNTVVLRKEELQ